MNLSVILMMAYLFVLAVLYLVRPSAIMYVWSVTIFAFPTTRSLVGPVPVYWFDIATIAALLVLVMNSRFKWPSGLIKWHWILIGYTFMFGLVIPTLRYGPSVESVYLWIHTGLAWMSFPIGVFIMAYRGSGSYRKALGYGLLTVLASLAAAAVIQKGDPAGALAVNEFYRGDLKGMWTESLYGINRYSLRPNGPYGAATTFAGVSAIIALCVFALRGVASPKWAWLAVALASVVTVLSLTRHVVLAALIGVMVVVLTSHVRQKVKATMTAVIVILAVGVVGVGLGWEDRVARTSGGVLTDVSISARLVEGPLRLAGLIASEPIIFVTGVGLDVQKLASYGVDVGAAGSGFVSNGFLLPLYYLGLGGALLILGFWVWVYQAAKRLPSPQRAVVLGLLAAAIVVIASDNYSFLEESAVSGLFLFAGFVVGRVYMLNSKNHQYNKLELSALR